MATKFRFTVLLITDDSEQAKTLGNLIKPSFRNFFVSKTEEDAIKVINKEKIDILLLGLSSLQANEACYLHLISAKKNVEDIVKRKFLLCSKDEIRKAFSICNKEIFDDYFITRPLYDPYHILIRLRFLRRLFKEQAEAALNENEGPELSMSDLCNYFDKVMTCETVVGDLNGESFNRLLDSIEQSMERLKSCVISDNSIPAASHERIVSLISDQAEQPLLTQVKEQQEAITQELNFRLQEVADIARIKKDSVENPAPVALGAAEILIVEDDAQYHDELYSLLVGHDCVVHSAITAADAVSLVNKITPSLILLDTSLPDMTPFFVIGKVRKKLPNTPIILLARPTDRSNVQECLNAGANGVVIKPVDAQVLLHKITAALKV